MRRISGVLGLLVFCFALSYQHLRNNTKEIQSNRDPAAVRQSFDFSNLQGEKLHQAIKSRLIAGLEFYKSQDGTGVGLGHFTLLDNTGEKKLACQEFGKVIISFEAEGVSVSGDKPYMEIEGHCDFSSDLTKINPLYIPVAKIMGEHPGDGEFQFNEGAVVTVRFTNLPQEWPRTWVLKTVKLQSEKGRQSVVVESQELQQILGRPVFLNW